MNKAHAVAGVLMLACLFIGGCSREAPPTKKQAGDPSDPGLYQADGTKAFKLAPVTVRSLPSTLTLNGTINPDATRAIHVTSLGSGRVVDLKVRLGDYVKKGQSLVVISSPDLSAAVADYQKAVAEEVLSHKGLDRAQLLYEHGATAQKDLEAAQADEEKAKVDVSASEQRVRVLGGDPAHPTSLIKLLAPVSGTIVEQNVSGFEGIKSLDNTPNLFTIADLSQVWLVCDVYENDLEDVHVGDSSEIRLNGIPDHVFRGKVANVSSILDPTTRSAKVRVVLPNPDGLLRPGMFAVATFQ